MNRRSIMDGRNQNNNYVLADGSFPKKKQYGWKKHPND
jgi:hypothetical protein